MAYKEMAIRLTADFLSETIGAKREWDNIFKMLKTNKQIKPCQPRILCPANIFQWWNKDIPRKQKIREFVVSRPALK